MKRLISIAVLISVFAVAGIASAYPITLQFSGVNNGQVISATIGNPLNRTLSVLTGSYQLSINGATPMSGVCVDPAFASSSPQSYDLTSITDPNSVYAKAAYLLSLSNATNGAAVQIAVWQTVWPAMGTTFSWTSSDPILLATLQGQVSGLVGQLATANLSAFDLSPYALASNGGYGAGYQDYVVDPPSQTAPVPEPATMFLLGSGFVGLAAFRKRSRK